MADLSRMLGDVYGGDEAAPSSPVAPSVPPWADESRLDDALSSWTPGPPADAPGPEREFAIEIDTAARPLDDDLAAALSEALVHPGQEAAAAPGPEPGVAPVPEAEAFALAVPAPDAPMAPPRPWQRGDDDIIAGRRAGRARARGRRR